MFTTLRNTAGTVLVGVALIIDSGTASAVTISDCVDGGGIVVRCSQQPVTNADKVLCAVPGKTIRIWCVGGFYGHQGPMEIFDPGGASRYH